MVWQFLPETCSSEESALDKAKIKKILCIAIFSLDSPGSSSYIVSIPTGTMNLPQEVFRIWNPAR
jgi:hypothetical protein